jgi:gluconokinase
MERPFAIAIGLDLGTTSCKAVALSREGQVVATASANVELHTDHTGRAEQDANEYWLAVCEVLRRVMLEAAPNIVTTIGLSGAMHSLLPIDAGNQPLGMARTWADTRAASVIADLRASCDVEAIYRATGCPVQALYHPAALRWMREHEPDRFSAVAKFVSITDFIAHRLTDKWQAGAGLASTTGLMRVDGGAWSKDALTLAGVERERLPLIGDEMLQITPDAANATGLPDGTFVRQGGSDGAMANFGAVGAEPGNIVVTLGTSGAVRRIVDAPTFDHQQRTWCYRLLQNRWLAGGAINGGGVVLDWVRHTFYSGNSDDDAAFPAMLDEAMTAPPGSGGLIVLPHHAGERNPYFRADMTGSMRGLTLNHRRAHIARATLEGIACTLATLLDIVRDLPPSLRDASQPIALTGGLTRHAAWMQLLADVLDTPLRPITLADASAIGAARIALQQFQSSSSGDPPDRPAQIVTPRSETRAAYRALRQRFDAINKPN